MTLTQFRELGGIAVWTVDDYQPIGQFHDPDARLHSTILESVSLWTVRDLPGGIRTYTLDVASLGTCGEWQFDVGREGDNLRSLLLTSEVDCLGGPPIHRPGGSLQPVPEPDLTLLLTIILVAMQLLSSTAQRKRR